MRGLGLVLLVINIFITLVNFLNIFCGRDSEQIKSNIVGMAINIMTIIIISDYLKMV